MLRIQQSDLEKLRRAAELAYPEEFCAVLIGRQLGGGANVSSVVPCRNEHPDPRKGYTISPEALLRAQRETRGKGLEVLGFVHSHPDHPPEPSKADRQMAYWPGRVYGIISVVRGRCVEERFYRLVGESPDPAFVPVTLTCEPE